MKNTLDTELNKIVILFLFFITLSITGLLLLLKIFIISSLGVIFSIPIFIALYLFFFIKVLSDVSDSINSINLSMYKKNINYLFIIYGISYLFIFTPQEDRSAWGYEYNVNNIHIILFVVNTFIFITALYFYKSFFAQNKTYETNDIDSYNNLNNEIIRFNVPSLLNAKNVTKTEDENGTIFKINVEETYFIVSGYYLSDVNSVISFLQYYYSYPLNKITFIEPSNNNDNTYPNKYCTDENITGNLVYLVKIKDLNS